VLWPDFGARELEAAVNDYRRRERRYGLTGDQVSKPGPALNSAPAPAII
jgi:undecaprenyl diphosphate synthase